MSAELLISTSILSSDFTRLGEEVQALVAAGSDWLHWDCMDGHFTVPLTFGPLLVEQIRPQTQAFLDVHLMVTNPEHQIPLAADAGADGISFHLEASDNCSELLADIRRRGCRSCLTINPGTPVAGLEPHLEQCDMVLVMGVTPGYSGQKYGPETTARIAQVRELIDRQGLPTLLQVDGGINEQTVRDAVGAGANVLVTASYVFNHPQGYAAALQRLRELAG